MSELDNLLDSTLDDIDDLPEFKTYPAGAHVVGASFKLDKMGDIDVIRLNFVYKEVAELANSQDEAPKAGDLSGAMFMLNHELGLGSFKKAALPFQEALGLGTLREIIEGVQDVECLISTTVRIDKKDSDKTYLNIKSIQVV